MISEKIKCNLSCNITCKPGYILFPRGIKCKQCAINKTTRYSVSTQVTYGNLGYKKITSKPEDKRTSTTIKAPTKRHLVVYGYQDKDNGKIYIGSTINGPEYRLRQHIKASIDGSMTRLHRRFTELNIETVEDFYKCFELHIAKDFGDDISKEMNIRNIEVKEIRAARSTTPRIGYNHYATFEEISEHVYGNALFNGLYLKAPSTSTNAGKTWTKKIKSSGIIKANCGLTSRSRTPDKIIVQLYPDGPYDKKNESNSTFNVGQEEEALAWRDVKAKEMYLKGALSLKKFTQYTAKWILE